MKKYKKSDNRMVRALLMFFGVLFVLLAVLGIFLPGLPTTPFLLLAAWCFMKSSEKMYRWLITNKLFGKYLKNYIEGRGVSLKIKIVVLLLLWLFIGYLIVFTKMNTFASIGISVIAVVVTFHILRLKTLKSENAIY